MKGIPLILVNPQQPIHGRLHSRPWIKHKSRPCGNMERLLGKEPPYMDQAQQNKTFVNEAAALFLRLSPEAQDAIIDLLKSLSSGR